VLDDPTRDHKGDVAVASERPQAAAEGAEQRAREGELIRISEDFRDIGKLS
jgi:hypothetical protein